MVEWSYGKFWLEFCGVCFGCDYEYVVVEFLCVDFFVYFDFCVLNEFVCDGWRISDFVFLVVDCIDYVVDL